MKKVLIINYYWPPTAGSGVQRWLKLTKYLSQFGWQPIVYTPSNPEGNSYDIALLSEIDPNVTVIKRRITEPYKLYKLLSGKGGNENIKANAIENSNNKGIANYIRSNYFIPDPRKWWIKPSVKFLKSWISKNRVEAIISTGPPHSMHLIARELHRKLSIPWIADFRDPWTKLFYFKHLNLTRRSKERHYWLEMSVLLEATKVVTVSNNIKNDFIKEYEEVLSSCNKEYCDDVGWNKNNCDNECCDEKVCNEKDCNESNCDRVKKHDKGEEKFVVIENGYDPTDFDEHNNLALKEEVEKIGKITSKKFVIAHTGLLTNSANPTLFWKALGNVAKESDEFRENLQIVLAGQIDSDVKSSISENGLSKFVIDMGYSSHPKAVAIQKRANILLLPLRKEPEAKGILTGKLFEYLASGSPIVAFGYRGCELEDILQTTNAGVLFDYGLDDNCKKCSQERSWDKEVKEDIKEEKESRDRDERKNDAEIEEIKKDIERIWCEYKNGTPIKNSSPNIEKYSRISQAECFAKLLDSL